MREAGDGADRPGTDTQLLRYVYTAWSRRSGGLSLGLDLTPQGHCSFSCVYCQASHPPIRNPDLSVDLGRLRNELTNKLRSLGADELRDLVLAGSGEPTSVPNVADALRAIRGVCDDAGFQRPRRIFTNGRHLNRVEIAETLVDWVGWGGEVWVKLDGATEATIEAVNGRRFEVARHLEGIWGLARRCEIGVQTMVVRGPSLPEPAAAVKEVAEAIATGLNGGAKIRELHLITLSRVPSDAAQASVLRAVEAAELRGLAEEMARLTGLSVQAYGAAADEDRQHGLESGVTAD